MKKHLALVLALVMVLSSFSFVSAAPDFADVEGTVYEDAVNRLELLNILKGYPDGTFKPEGSITRAEFSAVAVRARGLEGVAVSAQGLPSGFSDVPAWHWASGYVGTAGSMGIVNGIGNGLFAPEAPVKYEEAVTMLVRALGYESDAQAKGGYPYGYLIVAEEIDLLDGTVGTQGTWATRGFVAQITDNALEIPMMISVGTGTDARYIVSGEDRTEEVYLLDYMGFDVAEGRVVDFDEDDMEIEIDGEGDFEVMEGFDFYEASGVTVKAWYKDDVVVVYTLKDDVKFDAVKEDGDEVLLIGEDESYELNLHSDSPEDLVGDYAKVVFNDDEEVVWIDAHDMDFIVVEEMDEEVAVAYDDFDEVDLEDFTVVMGGKTVGLESIEESDVVFYNDDAEIAVIYNDSMVGEIERIYTDSFKFDGDVYDVLGDALYLDEDVMGELTVDILDEMADTDVEVFFNWAGDVVLVVGEGTAKSSSFYAVVIDDSVQYDGRRGQMVSVDVLTEYAEEVDYDLSESDLTKSSGTAIVIDTADYDIGLGVDDSGDELEFLNMPENDDLMKVTIDEDGDVDGMKKLNGTTGFETVAEDFEIDDTYVDTGLSGRVGYRLEDSTVIFYGHDGTDFDKVITLGEIDDEFAKVMAGAEVYVESGRVKVVLAYETDADTETTSESGLLTDVRLNTRTDQMEFTIEVAGEEMVYETTEDSFVAADVAVYEALLGKIVVFEIGDKSGELEEFVYDPVSGDAVDLGVIGDDTSDGSEVIFEDVNVEMFVVDEADRDELESDVYGVFELNNRRDVMIYEVEFDADGDYVDFDELDLEDTKGEMVTIYFDQNSPWFVNYVVMGSVTPAAEDEGEITSVNSTVGYESFAVDNETEYFLNAKTILLSSDGKIVETGANKVAALLEVGDEVEVSTRGDVMTVKVLNKALADYTAD